MYIDLEGLHTLSKAASQRVYLRLGVADSHRLEADIACHKKNPAEAGFGFEFNRATDDR